MRYQNSLSPEFSVDSVAASVSEGRPLLAQNTNYYASSENAPGRISTGKQVYSTRTRYSSVLENLRKSSEYIREQQKALNEMVQQFQLLSGYLEQTDRNLGANSHAWSVYLMHAQVVESCMSRTFEEKPLFNLDNDPPLRIHVPVDGELESFDLPLPSLRSIIPLGAFLHGASGRSMPSIGLLEDCMTAITNCLLEIQNARVIISDATRATRILRDSKSLDVTERSGPVFHVEKDLSTSTSSASNAGFFNWLLGVFARV